MATTKTINLNTDLVKTILLAGLLTGTLDIIAALVNFKLSTGKNPVIVLQYIASAVFGKTKAYSEGNDMIFFGAVFHFIIAYLFTILFFILYINFRFMSKNRLLTGIIYGILIWCVMNLVVVPVALNNYVKWNQQTWINLLILICMIGIPLSYIANWYFKKNAITSMSRGNADY